MVQAIDVDRAEACAGVVGNSPSGAKGVNTDESGYNLKAGRDGSLTVARAGLLQREDALGVPCRFHRSL
jgi:hypothetical protein